MWSKMDTANGFFDVVFLKDVIGCFAAEKSGILFLGILSSKSSIPLLGVVMSRKSAVKW